MTFSARSHPAAREFRTGLWLLAALGLGLGLSACGTDDAPAAQPAAASPTASVSPGGIGTASPSPTVTRERPRPTGPPRPMGHIHGVGRDPLSGDVVLATHGGLFRVDPTGPTPVGPVVDLMGFAIAADGSYLASGHPGTETDLPEPVGLIRSTDGGDTWTPVSRSGQSDFHGLTAGSGLVAGFDGTLRVSEDGRSWTERSIPSAPHVLAAAPDGSRLLATTQSGLLSTVDGGRSWESLDTPELLMAVSWADDETVVGVGVSGRLVLSEDSGATWSTGPKPVGPASSLHAGRTPDGVEVLAVVGDGVVSTTDLGRTVERVV